MNREAVIAKLTSPQATNFIDSLRPIFKDLPHLPLKVREILVQIVPWLAIIGAVGGAISGIQDILRAFGVRGDVYDFGNPAYWLVYGVLSLVSAYLAFLSFPLLRQRAYTGWILLFWGGILSLVMSAITLIFNSSYIIGFVISLAIGMYLTFEIESLYTAGGKVVAKVEEVTNKVTKAAKPSQKSAKK